MNVLIFRLDTNEQTFMNFLDQYKGDRDLDLMSLADQSERLDYMSNLARNNCVLLTGIYKVITHTNLKLCINL